MIDLSTLPPGAAHAVEAWRRAQGAANREHWQEEYERIYAALTPRAAARAAEVIAAIRAGATVRERPATRPPIAPAGVRFGGVWRS